MAYNAGVKALALSALILLAGCGGSGQTSFVGTYSGPCDIRDNNGGLVASGTITGEIHASGLTHFDVSTGINGSLDGTMTDAPPVQTIPLLWAWNGQPTPQNIQGTFALSGSHLSVSGVAFIQNGQLGSFHITGNLVKD